MIITYKGIKINYTVSGTGSPILFLHGFLENLKIWNLVIPHFEKNYTCIAIDLLGHGKSECLSDKHTMNEMALAAKSVLDILNIGHLQIIGHSMGGYVAMALLKLYPDLMTGLVLLNSTSYPDSKEKKIHRDRAIKMIKKNSNAFMGMAITNLFAQENRVRLRKEIDVAKQEASKTQLQGIISALEGMKTREDHTETLKKFNGKKIIFAGKQDTVLNFEHSKNEAVTYNVDLISFSGGHMSYLENREDLISALSKFLWQKKLQLDN